MKSIAVEFDPFRGGEVARTAPSTEPQREIITSAALSDEANTAFNEGVSLRVIGAVDPDAIERALRVVVGRHEALRMTFTRRGDRLTITEDNTLAMERLDFSALDAATREARTKALWRELVTTPMSLTDGPLFRALWIDLGSQTADLVLLAHHVICDGWSFYVILGEVSQLMGGAAPDSLEPAPSFADFAERQGAHAASNADADYWAAQFQTRPPVLDLPTNGARPAFRSFTASRVDHAFDAELVKAISVAAGKARASVVNVVLAGTAVLLHRLSGATDMAIGLPVARQGSEGLPNLVGHGVQLLPIRMQVEPTMTFQEIIASAKKGTLDARDHFNFTFGTLVRDLGLSGDPSRVPLVPVIFNIDQPFGTITFGSATATMRTLPRTAENFEMFLNVVPAKTELVVETTFNTDLFTSETVESWMAALESLLADGTETPTKTVSALRLSRTEPRVYETLNDTAVVRPDAVWLDRLEVIAAAKPDAVAVADSSGSLTYGELVGSARGLARTLLSHGVARGSFVGLHLSRSRELLVAIAGVHMAGGSYVPLDPSFPEARLAFMVENSGARIVLADGDLPASIVQTGVTALRFPLATVDGGDAKLPRVEPSDLAYVIYTSGSTGQPKGVEIPHGAVANLLDSMATTPGLTANDTLLAVTTLSFDISVLELLLPLVAGGKVVVATREESSDARKLMDLLERFDVTAMQATPSTWRLLLREGWVGRPLTALCGGEPLPIDLAAALLPKVGSLWNMYGPTETTIWSTCHRITSGTDPIVVGRPIDATVVYVMDANDEPLPASIPGEIWIGGAGLARGYHARPELTSERFVEHPRLGRLYRTGDRGRVLSSGVIEHMGRLDDQVKVRGFRIELAEIEAVLAEHPDVRQAAVRLWTVKADDVRIVACCVPKNAGSLAPISLRKHVRARLPEYMVPQYFLAVDAIPVSPNGKVDRNKLPTPVVTESRIGKVEAPADPVEAAIAAIWTGLIHPSRPVGRVDRFFEMGGHSLLALEALRQIDEKLSVRLDPRVLYLETLADIAARCRAQQSAAEGGEARASRPEPLADGAPIFLTENQERIYRDWRADPSDLRYSLPFSTKLTGELDYRAFEASWRGVFQRQSALRTVVVPGPKGPEQKVRTVDEMCVVERSDQSSHADPDAAAMAYMIELTKRPFDLAAGPLLRIHLIKLAEGVHQLFLMPHQIVFDGWSFDIVLTELEQQYTQLTGGRASQSKPPVLHFGDFSTWHRQRGATNDPRVLEYWERVLRDLPRPIEWPGGSAGGERVQRVPFFIPRDVLARYEHYCAEQKIGPQTLLLAAFARVLASGLGRRDLVVGLASAGRFIPEVVRLVGLFFSNLPVRLNVSGSESGPELLKLVQSTVQASSGLQDITLNQLERIAANVGSEGRLRIQVAFSYQDSRNRPTSIAGLQSREMNVPRPDLTTDLEFWVRHTANGLIASLDYRAPISNVAPIERLRDELIRTLDCWTGGPSLPEAASDAWLSRRATAATARATR